MVSRLSFSSFEPITLSIDSINITPDETISYKDIPSIDPSSIEFIQMPPFYSDKKYRQFLLSLPTRDLEKLSTLFKTILLQSSLGTEHEEGVKIAALFFWVESIRGRCELVSDLLSDYKFRVELSKFSNVLGYSNYISWVFEYIPKEHIPICLSILPLTAFSELSKVISQDSLANWSLFKAVDLFINRPNLQIFIYFLKVIEKHYRALCIEKQRSFAEAIATSILKTAENFEIYLRVILYFDPIFHMRVINALFESSAPEPSILEISRILFSEDSWHSGVIRHSPIQNLSSKVLTTLLKTDTRVDYHLLSELVLTTVENNTASVIDVLRSNLAPQSLKEAAVELALKRNPFLVFAVSLFTQNEIIDRLYPPEKRLELAKNSTIISSRSFSYMALTYTDLQIPERFKQRFSELPDLSKPLLHTHVLFEAGVRLPSVLPVLFDKLSDGYQLVLAAARILDFRTRSECKQYFFRHGSLFQSVVPFLWGDFRRIRKLFQKAFNGFRLTALNNGFSIHQLEQSELYSDSEMIEIFEFSVSQSTPNEHVRIPISPSRLTDRIIRFYLRSVERGNIPALRALTHLGIPVPTVLRPNVLDRLKEIVRNLPEDALSEQIFYFTAGLLLTPEEFEEIITIAIRHFPDQVTPYTRLHRLHLQLFEAILFFGNEVTYQIFLDRMVAIHERRRPDFLALVYLFHRSLLSHKFRNIALYDRAFLRYRKFFPNEFSPIELAIHIPERDIDPRIFSTPLDRIQDLLIRTQERAWMEMVDLKQHRYGRRCYDEGLHGADLREPYCVESYLDGRRLIIESCNQFIDVDYILRLHGRVTGNFRKQGFTGFTSQGSGILREDTVTCYVAKFTNRATQEMTNRGVMLAPASIYSIPYCSQQHVLYPRYSKTQLQNYIEKTLKTYYIGIMDSETEEERLHCIARFWIELEDLHITPDGSGRLGRLIITQFLLENGFTPVVMDDPNNIYGRSISELVIAIKEGMQRWKELVDPC